MERQAEIIDTLQIDCEIVMANDWTIVDFKCPTEEDAYFQILGNSINFLFLIFLRLMHYKRPIRSIRLNYDLLDLMYYFIY